MHPLKVIASLTLLSGAGHELRINANGDRVAVDLSSPWVGLTLLRTHFHDRAHRQHALATLQTQLRNADLTVEFRVGQRVIALLSPDARPTYLSRWLGLSALRIRFLPLLLSLWHH